MEMSKYSDIEIQTAKNLLKEGFKWLDINCYGILYAYKHNPDKVYVPENTSRVICSDYVPIFESINFGDEPVSLESIVHPQILDDAEKRYLSAVIRPFRDNVKSISKCISYPSREFIAIYCKNGDKTLFPWFEAGTMYQGMERYKEYTVEELGL